jgi:hypothetical protein
MTVKTSQQLKARKKPDFWRKLYIRLLLEEAEEVKPWDDLTQEDRELELGAIEDLVDAGYLAGSVNKDASGIPKSAQTRGPTLAGRIFAEAQQDILDKKSIFNRIKSGAGLFVGWVSGIISAVIIWKLTK